MLGNQISDQELSKNVNKRLVRINAPPKVLAGVSRGTVTLSGQLKYENQRKQITKAVVRDSRSHASGRHAAISSQEDRRST